jgi:hypothetical protein
LAGRCKTFAILVPDQSNLNFKYFKPSTIASPASFALKDSFAALSRVEGLWTGFAGFGMGWGIISFSSL